MELDIRAIKVLMAQRGIETQRELAAMVGLSDNAISELFLGKRIPSLETVGALCRVLACTPNDILIVSAPKAQAPADQPTAQARVNELAHAVTVGA